MNGLRKPTPVILRAIAALSDAAGMGDGDEYRYLAVRNDLQELWKDIDHYGTEIKTSEKVVDGSDYEALLEMITT